MAMLSEKNKNLSTGKNLQPNITEKANKHKPSESSKILYRNIPSTNIAINTENNK